MQSIIDRVNRHPKAFLLSLIAVVFGITSIVIFLMIVSLNNTIKTPTVTPDVTNQILSEIIKNNPKELITPNSPNVVPRNPQQIQQGNNQSLVPNNGMPNQAVPNLNEYNYRSTTTTQTPGPAFALCSSLSSMGGHYGNQESNNTAVVTTEYKEYFEKYFTYFKGVTREDNKLSSLYINKFGKDINTSTNYLEGNYAVENSYRPYPEYYNQSDVQSISYPSSLEEFVSNYFGNNATISGIATDDISGQKYFLVQFSVSSYCDPTYNPYLITNDATPETKNIINVYKVNATNFTIEQSLRYLDQINPQNLITSTTSNITRAKVTRNEIDSQFALSSNITIVKNDFSNVNYNVDTKEELKSKVDFLKNKNFDLLLPKVSNPLGNLFAPAYVSPFYVDTFAFYKDRLFYPQTTWGDVLFERYNKVYSREGMNYSLSFNIDQYTSYYISMFTGISLNSLEQEHSDTKVTSKSIENKTLKINGSNVQATKILKQFSYYYPTSYTSYPSSYTTTNTYYQTVYLFEFNNNVYEVSLNNGINQLNFDSAEFTLFDLESESNVESAKNKVIEMYNLYLSLWQYPSSYPVSYP